MSQTAVPMKHTINYLIDNDKDEIIMSFSRSIPNNRMTVVQTKAMIVALKSSLDAIEERKKVKDGKQRPGQ